MATNQTEVKALWDEYRIGKSYPCLSDLLQHGVYHVPKNGIKKRYDIGEQRIQKEPKPGSIYYVETIDPPPWFEHSLEHDNIVVALKRDNGVKRKRSRRAKRR